MSGMAEAKTAIVVGAGAGGVATAARLAKAGYKVSVFEKNDYTGGRCSLIHHDGYRFDRGPSLLLLPDQFHQTFADLDTSLEAEGVELLKCTPNYLVHFHDGESMELSTDLARMKHEVERYEGTGGFERYLAFMGEAHRHYTLSVKHVLSRPFSSILSMARPSFVKQIFTLHPLTSLWTRACIYFRSERLRRAFTFGSMYMGMSPFEAPATYSLLQYTELAEGIWYPVGGFHAVVAALVRVGERFGVTYHLSTPVSRVEVDPATKRATGITLLSGVYHAADLVVINADLVTAYNTLLPHTSYAEQLSNRRTSCSSISFYWALSQTAPQLHTHNIFLAEHYQPSFDSIFRDRQLPTDPSFYVNVPSRVDPSAAPANCDSIVVLVPCGHLDASEPNAQPSISANGITTTNPPTANGTSSKPPPTASTAQQQSEHWKSLVAATRTRILDTIKARTGADLGPLIRHEEVATPPSWATELGLDRGAILGLAHDFFSVLGFRPRTRARGVGACWFVGASTHPGTGVPIVLAGAKLVVAQILQDAADTQMGKGPLAVSAGEWWRAVVWEWRDLFEMGAQEEENEGMMVDGNGKSGNGKMAVGKAKAKGKGQQADMDRLDSSSGGPLLLGFGVWVPWVLVLLVGLALAVLVGQGSVSFPFAFPFSPLGTLPGTGASSL